MNKFLKKVVTLPLIIIYLFTALFGGVPFSHADDSEDDEQVFYYLTDHLGGIDAVVDENGTVVERNDYLPFGDERMSIGDADGSASSPQSEDYGFTGKEKDDETDLNYYGARYYDSKLGRFTQMDPLVLNQTKRTNKNLQNYLIQPQALNGYSYVLNNPLKFVDSTGEFAETILDVISLSLSTYDFYRDPSLFNGAFVALDSAGSVIPFIPAAAGYIKNSVRAVKILKYFSEVATSSKKGVMEIVKIFGENVGTRLSRRVWSIGEAENDIASLVGHFSLHGEEVGAKTVKEYYEKANDFLSSPKNYSWKEGKDTVFFNTENHLAAYTKENGEIRSFYKITKENKLKNYQEKVKSIEKTK